MQAHGTACWAAICFGRRFSLLPRQPGIDWHGWFSWNTNASSSSLSLSPAPLWWLLYLKDMPSALAHSCIFLEIKLTWANVPGTIHSGQLPMQHLVMTSLCGAKRLYSSLDLYHAHFVHTHRHSYIHMHMQTHNACMHFSVSQISQSAGLSLAGCSKEECGPKKYWLWGYYGNSLPSGMGCLLNCSLVC